MPDAGLQKIKLQDGYKKLLVSELDSGIVGAMTKVSTSTGTQISGTVLWMGYGENNDGYMMKIKATQNSSPFMKITSKNGTAIDGDQEYDILQFIGDSSGGVSKQGRGVWKSRCQIDYYNNGRIEFVNGDQITLDQVPTIMRSVSGDVQFIHPQAASTYWSFDRLKIASSENNIAVVEADGVDFTIGDLTADSFTMSSAATMSHLGLSTTISNSVAVNLSGHDLLNLWGAKETRLEAMCGDGEGDAVLYIDTYQHDDQGNGTIKIGTNKTAQRDVEHDSTVVTTYGVQSITLGVESDTATLKTLNLNSDRVICGNSMIIQDLADNAWDDGWTEAYVTTSQASFYSIDETAGPYPGWYDGKNGDNYALEKLQIGHSRMPIYKDIAGTSSTTPAGAITGLSDGDFQIYVKDGKLIFACNDDGTARFFSFDGRAEAAIEELTYGTSEPA